MHIEYGHMLYCGGQHNFPVGQRRFPVKLGGIYNLFKTSYEGLRYMVVQDIRSVFGLTLVNVEQIVYHIRIATNYKLQMFIVLFRSYGLLNQTSLARYCSPRLFEDCLKKFPSLFAHMAKCGCWLRVNIAYGPLSCIFLVNVCIRSTIAYFLSELGVITIA